ncbi:MAG: T9SS type A sorting domain-containing protein [Flavipsychrobacter sp.]|nr:T9SS type A sorting domain-containing protein [Flavipsychrobacter sp.]
MKLSCTRHDWATKRNLSTFKNKEKVVKFFTVALILLIGQVGRAQTSTIYSQNFGTAVVASSSVASTLSGSGITWALSGAQSGNLSIGTSVSSTTYSGASGGGAFEDGAGTPVIGTGIATITGLSTAGYTGIAISFGAYKSSSSETTTLTISYSTDGGTTWNSTPLLTLVAASGLSNTTFTNLETISNISGSPLDNQSNLALQLKFTRTATGGSFRMDDLTITGSVSGLAPSPASLTGFNYVAGNGPSTAQSFTLTGSNLTSGGGNITVNGSTDYEISTDAGGTGTYHSSLTIPYTGTALSATTVWARLKSGLSSGTYNENLTYSGGGVSSANYAVTGNVNAGDYYSASTGDLNTLATWSSNTNGSGGSNPANFTTTGINFHLANSNPGTLTGTAGGSITFSSNITGAAAGPLTFLGTSTTSAATLALNGTNTFTGGLTVGGAATTNIGILSLPVSATSSTLPSTGTVTINAGSCLLVAATGVSYSNPLILNGVGNSTDAGAIRAGVPSLTFTGNVTLGATTYIYSTGTNVNNINLQGNVSDGGNGYVIQKQGGGNLNFTSSTPNTWSGGLIMANGNVSVSSTSSIGNGPLSFPGSNATTLTLNNTSQTISSLSSVAGAGLQNIALPAGGTLTINQSGNTTFGDAAAGLVTITDGTSTSTVEKQGVGTLTLTTGGTSGTSNNTFGTLKITGGTVILNPYTTVTSGSTSLILNGGSLSTSGIASSAATFTTLQLTDNSTISLSASSHTLSFAASSAVSWTSGKTLIINGWQGNYTNGSSPTGGRIYVGSASGNLSTAQLAQVLFYNGTDYYFSTQTSSGEIVPNGIDNNVTDYYSNSNGSIDVLSTWNTNTAGSGGSAPTSFTANYQVFHLANSNAAAISGSSWTVSGTGSAITLDQGVDLTISSTKAITGTINLGAGRTLTISNATLPTLGTMAANSTVDYLNISGGISTISATTYGNVIFDNTSYTPGTGQTLNLAGNLTLQNSASINSVSSSAGVTLNIAGTGNQTITGNSNTITLYRLTNNTNTTGTLTLAASTPLAVKDNITLVQNGSSNQFSDGGNTITAGNNLYMDGNAAGYNFTGTIILNAASGSANVGANSGGASAIAASLNNFQVNTTGTAITNFYPTSGGGTVNVKGTFTVAATTAKAIAFNANTINLGGNFTYNPTTDLTATTGGSIGSITFSGTAAQTFTSAFVTTPGINFNNWTVSNTSSTVTLSAPVKVVMITTINSGANLVLNNRLQSSGSASGLVNNGTISGTTGEFYLSGTSLVPTISGTGSISVLENARTANINLTSGTQTITDSLLLTGAGGTLTISSGANINIAPGAVVSWPTAATTVLASGTNGLVLKSDNTGTGRIDQMPASSSITGTVSIERYIPGQRGYRLLGQPYTANQDLSALTPYFDITGITSGSTCSGTSASAFSYTPGTSPAFTGITSGTGAFPAATNTSASQSNGILAFVRGAKGEGCNSNLNYTPSNVTVVTSGTINQGTITQVVPANGWNLIANPYPSQIDLSSVTNISSLDHIKIVNPAGQFVNVHTNGTQYADGSSSTIIPVNGAFLAHNGTGSDLTLTFSETNKTASTPVSTVFKTTNTYPTLQLSVYNGNSFWDNWTLNMKPGTREVAGDAGDLDKISNAQFDIYSLSKDNKSLNFDARDADTIADGDIIHMGIRSVPQSNYTLEVSEYTLPVNKTVYLHDKYTSTYTLLSNGLTYSFAVNADTASQGQNRMELVFNSDKTGVNNISNSAQGITLVPNPAIRNITVTYATIFAGSKDISIVNLMGQVVTHISTAESSLTISVDNLPAGMYMLKTIVNGNSITERFIKN